MISGIFSVIGICLGVVLIVAFAAFGFAGGVMHLLRWMICKVRWLIGKDKT